MRRRSRGGSDSTLCPCSSRVHVPVVFEGTRFEYRLAVVSTTNSCASYIVMTMTRVISTLAFSLKDLFGIFVFTWRHEDVQNLWVWSGKNWKIQESTNIKFERLEDSRIQQVEGSKFRGLEWWNVRKFENLAIRKIKNSEIGKYRRFEKFGVTKIRKFNV